MNVHNIFITAKEWKQPKCPSTDKEINKIWSIYTLENYSTMKGMKF